MPIVFFCSSAGKYPHSWGACAFYAPIYSFQFISIHFISILFYSAWRKKRNVTNDNEKNEKNEKYRKLRNITKKRKNVVKKITLAWYFILKLYTFLYILRMFLLHFFYFSFVFLFFVNFVFIRYLWITIFLLNKIVIVRKRLFYNYRKKF